MAPQKKGPRGSRKYTPALVKAKKKIKDFEGGIVLLEADNSRLENANSELNKSVLHLELEKADMARELTTTAIRISQLDEANAALAERTSRAESEKVELNAQIGALNIQISRLHQDAYDREEQKKALERSCAGLEARVRELQGELDDSNEDVVMLVRDVRNLREAFDDVSKR